MSEKRIQESQVFQFAVDKPIKTYHFQVGHFPNVSYKKHGIPLYMPAGAFFPSKKHGFPLYMPAGAFFCLKKHGFPPYMPAGAFFPLKKHGMCIKVHNLYISHYSL